MSTNPYDKYLGPEDKREKLRKYQAEYYRTVRIQRMGKENAPRRTYLKGLTPEQKEQRRKEVAAAYYQRNKENIHQRERERRKGRVETPEQAAERKRKAVQASLKYKAKKKGAAKDRPERRGQKVYASRPVDTAALIPVRIDAKTVIYAKPGQDIEEIKQRYKKTG